MIVRVLGWNIAIGGEAVDLGMVVEAIRRSGADVVGLQECEGNAPRLAQLLGWAHVDERHQVISRWPIIEPHDAQGRYLYIVVEPTRVVALGNVHLPAESYGPYALRDGATIDEVVTLEQGLRGEAIAGALEGWLGVVGSGVPVVVTGDFNAPSHRDWGAGAADHRGRAVPWPVSMAMERAGFVDTYREQHPDRPGLTWTSGFPHPRREADELSDRIDFLWCSAGVRVADSALVGPSGVADVEVAVDPWPSDHLGVLTTLDLEPAPPPPYVGVVGSRIEVGDSIGVRWSTSGGAATDRIVLVAHGAATSEALAWIAPRETEHTGLVRLGSGGLGLGPYDVALVSRGIEIGRAAVQVVPRGARPWLSAVRSGGEVTVEWNDAWARKWDWIGLYRRGDPDLEHGWLQRVHTGATVSGHRTFRLAGDLTVRLFDDDSYCVLAEVDV